MARIALPLSILAAAALAACATPEPEQVYRASPTIGSATGQPVLIASGPVQPGTVITPATSVFKPGNGVVESIAAVHIVPAPSASTGASAPERLAYRLTIKMDDGTLQAVDQDNRGFQVGDRVQVAADGRVNKQ
jgi:hypothetical protein